MEDTRKKNNDTWNKIAKEMIRLGFTMPNMRQRAEQKWRNLCKAYKGILLNRKATGRGRKTFLYFKEMDDLLGKRHDIAPPVLGGNGCDPITIESLPSSAVPSCSSAEIPSTPPPPSITSLSPSASAQKRREKRKFEAEEDDVSVQTLKFLKEVEASRKLEAIEKAKRDDQRLILMAKLIDVMQN
jgi:hypothetical protein